MSQTDSTSTSGPVHNAPASPRAGCAIRQVWRLEVTPRRTLTEVRRQYYLAVTLGD
jgi:hypothetical protein